MVGMLPKIAIRSPTVHGWWDLDFRKSVKGTSQRDGEYPWPLALPRATVRRPHKKIVYGIAGLYLQNEWEYPSRNESLKQERFISHLDCYANHLITIDHDFYIFLMIRILTNLLCFSSDITMIKQVLIATLLVCLFVGCYAPFPDDDPRYEKSIRLKHLVWFSLINTNLSMLTWKIFDWFKFEMFDDLINQCIRSILNPVIEPWWCRVPKIMR